jgi:hypothetical protein
VPETRQMAGFVAALANLKTKRLQERVTVSLGFRAAVVSCSMSGVYEFCTSRFAPDNRPDFPMIHKTFGDESQS